MSTVDEAKLSWLKKLGVPDATITTLSAKPGAGAPGKPVTGNADSVPYLINGEDGARADTKKPVGNPFPGGVPDKDEQDKRDNRNDSGAIKGKMWPVKLPQKPAKQPPKGKAQPLRIVLVSSGIKADKDGPEPRTLVVIQGEIPIGSNSKADADEILKAIQGEVFKVTIGGVPAKVELRGAERYQPKKSRFAIRIWIHTRIPTIERPGKDEIVDAPVVVEIGDISSDGKATVKVHNKPPQQMQSR